MSNGVLTDSPILSRDASREIARRILRLRTVPGEVRVGVASSWLGDVRWARNRVATAGDRRSITIRVQHAFGNVVEARTSRIDDEGLVEVVAEAGRLLQDNGVWRDADPPPPRRTDFPHPVAWSESTMATSAESLGDLADRLLRPPADAGLWSAGYAALGAESSSWIGEDGEDIYAARTTAQCSVTVRSPQGSGSGWAGLSGYDWSALDPVALAERARQKCESSRLPSALEPGRYVVVLEPQAVADLLSLVVPVLERAPAEQGWGPFADPQRPGYSKLGQRLLDSRIDVRFDPEDPELGVFPFDEAGEPTRSAGWFEKGVLMALAYDRRYAISSFNENRALPNPQAVRMSGGATTVEEMIKSTRRGLLVSRFSGCAVLDYTSMLSTGHTRDGLWLIENGKVTRPVKNFRFTDSPLLMLNSVESLGKPVPVFRPEAPMIVPPIKATSFNFTRLVDAV